jgi:hypothetical protein
MDQAQRHTENAAPGPRRQGRNPNVMFADEVADRLGLTVEQFHRNRGRLHADDGMPPALFRHRPFRFNRLKMEAWLNRDRDVPPAANDAAPVEPNSLAEHRARLSIAYRQ